VTNKLGSKPTQKEVLSRYLPEGTVDQLMVYFSQYRVKFKIVKPRSTKLGDFRVRSKNEIPEITVNGNLNPNSFLITAVHEFAHLKTFLEHSFKVAPHGIEWKQNFVALMYPFVQLKSLPKDIESALLKSFVNVKASSCTDIHLQRVLKSYDRIDSNEILLEQISKNSTFALQEKVFKKGVLRRTRYMCEELSTGKKYLINALATVKLIEEDGK